MMRSPRYFAVACRRLSDRRIVVEREPVEHTLRSVLWLNKPFLRGTFALIDSMALGMKALTYAANVQMQDEAAQAPSEHRNGAHRNGSAHEEAVAAGAAN